MRIHGVPLRFPSFHNALHTIRISMNGVPRTRRYRDLFTLRDKFSHLLVGVTGATAIFLFVYAVHYVHSTSADGVQIRRETKEVFVEPPPYHHGPTSSSSSEPTALPPKSAPKPRPKSELPACVPPPGSAPPAPAIGSRSSFYDDPRYPPPRDTFCVVIGPEGTGSTWLSQIIPATHRPNPNPLRPPNTASATLFELWSSGPIEIVNRARTMFARRMRGDMGPGGSAASRSRFAVHHASHPDFNSEHYPDLHSSLWRRFQEAGIRLRVVLTYRDPVEAAHSNHRRQFKHLRVGSHPKNDIVCAARFTEKHMTLLSNQLEALETRGGAVGQDDVIAVSYHRMLEDPKGQARRLAAYLGFDAKQQETLRNAIINGKRAASNYTQRLTRPEIDFLHDFFDTERAYKWRHLREATERKWSL